MIETFSPDVFTIQESNISTADDIKDDQIEDYDLLIDKMHTKHGLARTSIYILQKIKYIRRPELESEYEPMIAITIYPIRAQPFNFINFYRQWQIVGLNGSIPGTYINFQLWKMLANGIYASKLAYSAELWIGAPIYMRKKIPVNPIGGSTNCNRQKKITEME